MIQDRKRVGRSWRRPVTRGKGGALNLARSTLRRCVTACLLLAATASLAEAQRASSFAQLPLLIGPGDTITVTDRTGREMKGRIKNLSPSTLALLVDGIRHDLTDADVALVRQRRPDSLSDGALRGFAVGALVGTVAVWSAGAPGLIPFAALGQGVLGLGVGVAVDAAISSRKTIYGRAGSTRRLAVSPLLSRERQGVLLSVGF